MKRVITSTLCGLVAGVICASLASAGHLLKLTAVSLGWILLNRAVMGFAIGTSGLKLRWAWNGIVMGLVVGSIFSYTLFMNGQPAKFALLTVMANAVFGFLIEFFTSVVFKQRAQPSSRPMVRAAAA